MKKMILFSYAFFLTLTSSSPLWAMPSTDFLFSTDFEKSKSESNFANNEKDKEIFLEIGNQIHDYLKIKFKNRFQTLSKKHESTLIKTDKQALLWISTLTHQEFKQCGGYFTHLDEKKAVESFHNPVTEYHFKSEKIGLYEINQPAQVDHLITNAEEGTIKEVIVKLSSFHNRYYEAETGVESQVYIKETWEKILKNRADSDVKLYEHRSWLQPSVVATIEGSVSPDEYIIIGGHGDSIAGTWFRSRAKAPGADDNASGIATMTEVMRTLIQSNFKPNKTIVFISYAAEEVGLLGSQEIAAKFRSENKNVVGAIQLDMTNFNGSEEDIILVSDNTNNEQNQFLGNLLDAYFPELKWANDKCGYACSDHASWHKQGYPVSAPFEAKKRKMNHSIHSKNDTIEKSGNNAEHALKFAKLTLAFIAEIDK